jgi:hypothetical protein
VDRIADAADRMERLIDDLLALARQGATVGAPRPVDLPALAERAWGNVETSSATLAVDPAVPRIAADPDRLAQLLENLYRNSVQYAGPDVHVTVGPLDDGDGFYVADDGCGIPRTERESVMERGYSTAADGTVFGLGIVGEIARAHDWTVTVTESPAGGACFEIRTTARPWLASSVETPEVHWVGADAPGAVNGGMTQVIADLTVSVERAFEADGETLLDVLADPSVLSSVERVRRAEETRAAATGPPPRPQPGDTYVGDLTVPASAAGGEPGRSIDVDGTSPGAPGVGSVAFESYFSVESYDAGRLVFTGGGDADEGSFDARIVVAVADVPGGAVVRVDAAMDVAGDVATAGAEPVREAVTALLDCYLSGVERTVEPRS